MSVGNEQELLNKSQNGDLNALGSIYDLYNQGLYRYAIRLLGDDSLAEDCVSETFSRFLHALQQKKGPKDHLQAYLYRIAHNWITDCYRKKDFFSISINEESFISHEPSAEAQSTLQSEKEKVRRALQQLPPNQRLVITLRFFEEWDNETVSAALKKPIGAIKALQHRGMMNLRNKLSLKD
ncbi:ECF RNA polymerase sigma factor SigW [bioreactor metagenome]|uniref:ECF RNA polymerase sigma factor SigW n=1 Tax=bioreactor metagenome TaxID=1076179 RepID=A0A644YZ59_9ZZZZ